MNKSYTAYTDGGARGNPGPAAIGGIIKHGEETVVEFSETIGPTTNNQAEYMAIIKALEFARDKDIDEITCYLDSELVVKQVQGEYKVKNIDLQAIYNKVIILIEQFKRIRFIHIPREKNVIADSLVNKALDS